jgi:hypothetical protein
MNTKPHDSDGGDEVGGGGHVSAAKHLQHHFFVKAGRKKVFFVGERGGSDGREGYTSSLWKEY